MAEDEPSVPLPQRKRALSFEEIEEEYQERQHHQRISIQISDNDDSSEESGEEALSSEGAAFRMAEVQPRFQYERALGKGSYGFVVKAIDTHCGGRSVAIKRIEQVFSSTASARRVLVEVRLLRQLGSHPHITGLHALLVAGNADPLTFNSVYMVLEPCAADLHKVLNSTVKLLPSQVFLET